MAHQQALHEQTGNAYQQALGALRTPVRHGKPDTAPGSRAVLGIASALTDDAAQTELQ